MKSQGKDTTEKVRRMKELKKLSLKEELDREAEKIGEEAGKRRDLDDLTVSEEAETSLFNKIQDYEYDKRFKKTVHRSRKKRRILLAVAAVLVLICGSVITGTGSKSYLQVLMERISGNEQVTVINVEDMDAPTRCGFVALLGAPNAGKSTITNNFVGSKVSIVSPKAQTTRTTVKGIGIWGNSQIIFLDTPGIFKPKRRLDRAMVASAWGGVSDADMTVLVVDAKRGFDDETKAIIQKLSENHIDAVLVLNKIDLVNEEKLLKLCAELNGAYPFKETFMISAMDGKGTDDFYQYLADNLPESPWFYPEEQMSDLPLKLLAAEIVREKLFLYLRQELPYALTVEPELWERREDNSVRAEMTIYVERDSQKQIVLGRGGAMIKKIGQAARHELEDLLEDRIHLFLFVKVRENWGDDPARYADWNLDFRA